MEIALQKENFPLMKHCAKGNKMLEHSGAPKSGKFPELQEKLFKYFVEIQNNGNDVSKKMLQL
jgi:hypothetical protein